MREAIETHTRCSSFERRAEAYQEEGVQIHVLDVVPLSFLQATRIRSTNVVLLKPSPGYDGPARNSDEPHRELKTRIPPRQRLPPEIAQPLAAWHPRIKDGRARL